MNVWEIIVLSTWDRMDERETVFFPPSLRLPHPLTSSIAFTGDGYETADMFLHRGAIWTAPDALGDRQKGRVETLLHSAPSLCPVV